MRWRGVETAISRHYLAWATHLCRDDRPRRFSRVLYSSIFHVTDSMPKGQSLTVICLAFRCTPRGCCLFACLHVIHDDAGTSLAISSAGEDSAVSPVTHQIRQLTISNEAQTRGHRAIMEGPERDIAARQVALAKREERMAEREAQVAKREGTVAIREETVGRSHGALVDQHGANSM